MLLYFEALKKFLFVLMAEFLECGMYMHVQYAHKPHPNMAIK